MPRGTISVQDLATNAGTVASAWTVDTSNNAYVAVPDQKLGRVFLHFKFTGGTAGTVSVLPGANPPSFRSGVGGSALGGTLNIVVPSGTTERLAVLESAQFIQTDGTVYLNFSASCVGTVLAYRMPKG